MSAQSHTSNNQSVPNASLAEQLKAQKGRKEDVQNYYEYFAHKGYYDEYKSAKKFAVSIRFLFSGISIAAGFYLLFSLFGQVMPEASAFVFAFLLLIGIEVIKHMLLPLNLKKIYTKKWKHYLTNAYNLGFICFNLALIALSVFLSVRGIEEYNIKERAVKPHLIDIKGIENKYATVEKNKLQAFEQQIRSKRKAIRNLDASIAQDRRNPANYFQEKFSYVLQKAHDKREQQKASLNNQIARLEVQKAKVEERVAKERGEQLALAQKKNETATLKAIQETETNSGLLLGIAALNELLLLLALWFPVHYAYQTVQELELYEYGDETVTLTPKDLPMIFNNIKGLLHQDHGAKVLRHYEERGKAEVVASVDALTNKEVNQERGGHDKTVYAKASENNAVENDHKIGFMLSYMKGDAKDSTTPVSSLPKTEVVERVIEKVVEIPAMKEVEKLIKDLNDNLSTKISNETLVKPDEANLVQAPVPLPVAGYKIVCEVCGTEVIKKSSKAKTCSARCRQALSRRKKGQKT